MSVSTPTSHTPDWSFLPKTFPEYKKYFELYSIDSEFTFQTYIQIKNLNWRHTIVAFQTPLKVQESTLKNIVQILEESQIHGTEDDRENIRGSIEEVIYRTTCLIASLCEIDLIPGKTKFRNIDPDILREKVPNFETIAKLVQKIDTFYPKSPQTELSPSTPPQ